MGQPRGAAAANQRRGAREFRVGFPLSAHELLVARERHTGIGKKKKKKKRVRKCTHEQGETGRLYTVGKKERGRRRKEKKKEKSDEFASHCPPRTRERASERGEGEGVRRGEER